MNASKSLARLSSLRDDVELLPSQKEIYARLAATAQAVPVTAYSAPPGMGRTTILRKLARDLDAEFVDQRRVALILRSFEANKWHEAVYDLLLGALRGRGMLIFDGYSEFCRIGGIRSHLLAIMMRNLNEIAMREGFRLILGGDLVRPWESIAEIFGDAAASVTSGLLRIDDYRFYLERELGKIVSAVDIGRLYRGSPMLDMYQLSFLARRLRLASEPIDTAHVENLVEAEILRTNVSLEKVEALSFDRLPGSEHIADALETHIVLPFERRDLAEQFELKPRRGVLLYGPPGTGKTSIGRALAHRMQGRFFLLDGSFVTEPPSVFFAAVERLVEDAKANAPSVLFIDDADVLFEIEHVQGLCRYLLSLLDGIESETASNVCIVMTAMDARKIPEALMRSGRVELWLETKAPNAATRTRILQRWLADELPALDEIDFEELASLTEGFSPADLRRLASDAKIFYAADMAAGCPLAKAHDYLVQAVSDLAALRDAMATRLSQDSMRTRAYA